MHYDNSNRGVLFKNEKDGNDQRPDYKGSINVGGTDYDLSAWIKSSKAGVKYMSLSVQPKREKKSAPIASATAQPPAFNDDEIPF